MLVETNPDDDAPDVAIVRFLDDLMVWEFTDGRVATAPLTNWPTLWLATREERETLQIHRASVYWPLLDADIPSDHILKGVREHRALARKAWDKWMDRQYAPAA